jgi:hypothetical protein
MALPQEFFDLLDKNKCELLQDGKRLLVLSSKPLPLTEKNLIKYYLEGIQSQQEVKLPVVFETGPKNETLIALKRLVYKISSQTRCSIKHDFSSPDKKPTHMKITFTCVGKNEDCDELDNDATWEEICAIMNNDGYFESWEFQDFFYNKAAAAALATNKCMSHSVTTEDVKDVCILVNAYPTVDEFLAHV